MFRLLVPLKMVLLCFLMITQVTGIHNSFKTHKGHCLNVTFATNTSLWMNPWSFTVLKFIVDNKNANSFAQTANARARIKTVFSFSPTFSCTLCVHMFRVEVYNQTQPRRPITGLITRLNRVDQWQGSELSSHRQTHRQTDSPLVEMA